MDLQRIGVMGAGVIGTTVAQDLAQTGHDVVLVDTTSEILAHALDEIASAARFHHLVGGGERQDVGQVTARVHPTTDIASLAEVDYVIENVTEDRDVKRAVYTELDRVCPPACVFAANTSVIPITTIASYTSRPENVVGIHFMNPVPLKSAVELIRGDLTSDRAIDTTETLLSQMNKRPIAVGDSPGFVSNRVLMQTINETVFLVQEAVADPRDIDDVFTSCFGHKMGPLRTADLIGLDTILRSIEELQIELPNGRFQPCPLLRTMVDAGDLGQKSGRGFYTYEKET
ncbi:MAG: 3-hydroxyacyl-CoA dehydrogenase family protein [Acidimicrobiales bacterium]